MLQVENHTALAQEDPAVLATQLAKARVTLMARDKTIEALQNRLRERQRSQSTAFATLEENTALQQVVERKTQELEEKRRLAGGSGKER